MQKVVFIKKVFSLAFILFFISSSSILGQVKQSGVIKFDKMIHDFGEIEENKGNATYKFVFENIGERPITISKVKASCGCTSPSWSKKPILPGTAGYVQATYKTRNRPGNFNKSVTVYSNASNSRTTLRIKGRVVPRAKTVEELYPRKLGKLWLGTQHASFARVRNTQEKTFILKGYNSSTEKIKVEIKRLPLYISAELPDRDIQPKEKFNIPIKFNAKLLRNQWGKKSGNYSIYINGSPVNNQKLKITATVIEDFSKLTPKQRVNAPIININEKVFDFKELKQGESIAKELTITNKGKSNLIIRKIDTDTDLITARVRHSRISPNRQTKLRIRFNSRQQKKGKYYKLITLICNDPKSSIIKIRVGGSII